MAATSGEREWSMKEAVASQWRAAPSGSELGQNPWPRGQDPPIAGRLYHIHERSLNSL